MEYEVLIYYKYVDIVDPIAIMDSQKKLCADLGLKGRIILAKEGINGTLEGDKLSTKKYIEETLKIKYFDDIRFKRSDSNGNSFPRMSIRVRDEIVSGHLGQNDIKPIQIAGKYIYPEELHDWIHGGKELYIVDMRNDYEQLVGYFDKSILAPFENFRDMPKILPKLNSLKNKTIITVCTSGVRCEKASGFLVDNGFTDVYQLHDGIMAYMQKYPNEDFLGKLYVFDGRVTIGFNLDDTKRVIVGKCEICGSNCEIYTNCANLKCHKHFICCDKCTKNGLKYCTKCREEVNVE